MQTLVDTTSAAVTVVPELAPSDSGSRHGMIVVLPVAVLVVAAAVAGPLVSDRAGLAARITASVVVAAFVTAAVVASASSRLGRLGRLLAALSAIGGLAVLSGSILEAHSLGSSVTSGLVSTAKLTQSFALGLLPVAVMHVLVCLPDGTCRLRRVAIGTGYGLGAAVALLTWWAWGNHLGSHLWPFGIETFVVLSFGISASVRRYLLAVGLERRRMQWFGCAALLEVVVLLIAIGLRLLWGWPTVVSLVLEVSALPYAGAVVLAASGRAEDGVERLFSFAVLLTGLTTVIVAIYVLVIVGYGPTMTASDHLVLSLSVIAAVVAAILCVSARSTLIRYAEHVVYGERQAPSSVLRTFGSRLSRAVPMDELILQVAESLHKSLSLQAAEIWLNRAGRLERAASVPNSGASRMMMSSEEQQVIASASPSGRAWVQIWLPALLSGREDALIRVAPATHSGELLGLIVAVRPAGAQSFDSDDDSMLAELARQLGLALHNVALDSALQASLDEVRRQAAELQASRARIVVASDAARRQIERNLHDGAQQHLVALAVNLRLARKLSETDPAASVELLDALGEGLNDAVRELRALAHGIYPPLLVDRGLAEALQSAASRSALLTEVRAEGLARYAPDEEAAVYFCCMEALQNAGKHAGEDATIVVEVREEEGALFFEVCDTGAGFDTGSVSRAGAGFSNMSDRVGAIGGSVTVRSAPGEGTSVSGRLPISQRAAH